VRPATTHITYNPCAGVLVDVRQDVVLLTGQMKHRSAASASARARKIDEPLNERFGVAYGRERRIDGHRAAIGLSRHQSRDIGKAW